MKHLILILTILTLGITAHPQKFVKYYCTDEAELIKSRNIYDSVLVQEGIPKEKAEELRFSGEDSLLLAESSKHYSKYKGYCIKAIDSTFYKYIVLDEGMIKLKTEKKGEFVLLTSATYSFIYYLLVIVLLMLILLDLEDLMW